MQQSTEVRTYPDGRMDAENTAKYIGCSEKTLANKRTTGTGPAYVKRGRIFYYLADVDAWMRAGRVSSTAQATVAPHSTIDAARAAAAGQALITGTSAPDEAADPAAVAVNVDAAPEVDQKHPQRPLVQRRATPKARQTARGRSQRQPNMAAT